MSGVAFIEEEDLLGKSLAVKILYANGAEQTVRLQQSSALELYKAYSDLLTTAKRKVFPAFTSSELVLINLADVTSIRITAGNVKTFLEKANEEA